MHLMSCHEGVHAGNIIGIDTGKKVYHVEGIDVPPVKDFLSRLHQGNFF